MSKGKMFAGKHEKKALISEAAGVAIDPAEEKDKTKVYTCNSCVSQLSFRRAFECKF